MTTSRNPVTKMGSVTRATASVEEPGSNAPALASASKTTTNTVSAIRDTTFRIRPANTPVSRYGHDPSTRSNMPTRTRRSSGIGMLAKRATRDRSTQTSSPTRKFRTYRRVNVILLAGACALAVRVAVCAISEGEPLVGALAQCAARVGSWDRTKPNALLGCHVGVVQHQLGGHAEAALPASGRERDADVYGQHVREPATHEPRRVAT
jgi:hypothetical protein